MTSYMRMSQKLVFHQSKFICAIKRILSTSAMYVSSSSFRYLHIPCYCDACLNSSALRVGVKTLLKTIHRFIRIIAFLLFFLINTMCSGFFTGAEQLKHGVTRVKAELDRGGQSFQ